MAVVLAGCGALFYAVQPPPRQAEMRRLIAVTLAPEKRVGLSALVVDLWQLFHPPHFVPATAALGAEALRPELDATARERLGTVRRLENQAYTVGYSEPLGVPVWAVYRLADVAALDAPPRPERFAVDERTAARIAPELYRDSGYDRGHLAPSFGIGTRYGAAAQRETFLMSNIVPQRATLNSGLWRALEQRLATSYAARFEEVWVLCGPVFGARPARIGGGRVAVPEAFWLVVVDAAAPVHGVGEGWRVIAWLVPHEGPLDAPEDAMLTSVDAIERCTGLDLFAGMDDAAERTLEAGRATVPW